MILGITGTIGAGKGTLVDYLVTQKGFEHHSVREFLLEEIKKRGLPEHRGSMRDVGNELRREHHPAHVVETLHKRAGANAIIESVRTVGEAEFLKALGASIVAIDADKKSRYDRAVARGSSTDKVTFEQFVEEEDREMASTEPWDMNVFAVMDMADFRIQNDGTEAELHAKIDEMLATLGS
ncbi:MAG: AAA family ATPase [Candidatus Pacebacteria bacterium]|nr:AAA family ATPase [Candidatus Paceibacterota bacterium]